MSLIDELIHCVAGDLGVEDATARTRFGAALAASPTPCSGEPLLAVSETCREALTVIASKALHTPPPQAHAFVVELLAGEIAHVCWNGAASVVRFMIECGSLAATKEGRHGALPLHSAVSNNAVDVIDVLLERGATLSDLSHGDMPLHVAALWGHHAVVKRLLDLGADPRALNTSRQLAFELALPEANRSWWIDFDERRHGLCMWLLFQAMAVEQHGEWNTFKVAAASGHADVVAACLAKGGVVKDAEVLVRALAHDAVAVLLIDAGWPVSDVVIQRARGAVLRKALMVHGGPLDERLIQDAVRRSDPDSVATLLAAGCAPTSHALEKAAMLCDFESARLLVAAGVVVPNWDALLLKVGNMLEWVEEVEEPSTVTLAADWRALADGSDTAGIEAARRRLVTAQRALIRERTVTICVALGELDLDALSMTEIIGAAVPFAERCPMHVVWDLVTRCKHFKH